MSERDEIIAEMREYFEQRADAEYLPGSPGGSPNEEMKMLEKLGQLQDSLESHHRDLLAIHRVASHIAGVEPPTEDDTLTVKRVKQMAMMINQLSDGQAAREQEGGEAVVVKDAYDGAREDLQIWKKRALESEKLLQEEIESNARLVEVCNDLTGPTHMGEPVLPPRQGAQEAKPIAYTNGSQLFYLWDEEGEGKMFAEREGDYDIALYTHPSQSQGVPEKLRRVLAAAISVAHDRKGDVDDEEGSYATTPVDQMIELETALCELFDTGSDDVVAHHMIPKLDALLSTPAAPQAGSFQSRVRPWLLECFGERIAGDREERNHRYLEESLELVQAEGCTAEEAHKLVDYVYSREIGDPPQEVGGVMVTLAALCLANDMDMHDCGESELARITQPETVKKIREKQKRKPSMSPLPGVYPERPQPPEQGVCQKDRCEHGVRHPHPCRDCEDREA